MLSYLPSQHLIEVAKHEQEMILQKLIYEDEGFKGWLQRERGIRAWINGDG